MGSDRATKHFHWRIRPWRSLLRTSPSLPFLELMTSIRRLTHPKLNTCYKPRKPFEEMANQNGCKWVPCFQAMGRKAHSFKVTGSLHDLGNLLLLFGAEGQWNVVGVSQNLYVLSSTPQLICDLLGHIWYWSFRLGSYSRFWLFSRWVQIFRQDYLPRNFPKQPR